MVHTLLLDHSFNVFSWRNWVLLHFTVSLFLLGFTGFYWVLLGFTGFYWVFRHFNVVMQGPIGSFRIRRVLARLR